MVPMWVDCRSRKMILSGLEQLMVMCSTLRDRGSETIWETFDSYISQCWTVNSETWHEIWPLCITILIWQELACSVMLHLLTCSSADGVYTGVWAIYCNVMTYCTCDALIKCVCIYMSCGRVAVFIGVHRQHFSHTSELTSLKLMHLFL